MDVEKGGDERKFETRIYDENVNMYNSITPLLDNVEGVDTVW